MNTGMVVRVVLRGRAIHTLDEFIAGSLEFGEIYFHAGADSVETQYS